MRKITLSLAILLLALAACGSGDDTATKLVGKWNGTLPAADSPLPAVIEFGDNGKAIATVNAGIVVTLNLDWSWDGQCLRLDDTSTSEDDPGCNAIEFVGDDSFIMTNEEGQDSAWSRAK